MAKYLVLYAECDIGRLSNFTYFENRTNFSADQYTEYVNAYAYLQCVTIQAITEAGFISFTTAGLIGLIGYILMFFTLIKLSISECTLVYYRAMVVLELVHMIIMTQDGIIQLLSNQIPNSLLWMFWYAAAGGGWRFGDASKLAVSMITAFLAVERFVAVCMTLEFNKINQLKVAYSAIVVSLFIGTVHFYQIFTIGIALDPTSGRYVTVVTWFNNSSFYHFTDMFIYVTKVFLCVFIFILCLATAIGLKVQTRKVWSMNSEAAKEWKVKKQACALAFILGASTFVDHIVWVLYKWFRGTITDNGGEWALLNQTYAKAMADLQFRLFVSIIELSQRLLGEFVHCGRFFIYLALNRPMREACRKLIGK